MPKSPVGQCLSCTHATVQTSAKGQDFLRCRLADEDDRFLRYPPLPVRDCAGFRADEANATSDAAPTRGAS